MIKILKKSILFFAIITLIISNTSCTKEYFVYNRHLPYGYLELLYLDLKSNNYIWRLDEDSSTWMRISYGKFTLKNDTISFQTDDLKRLKLDALNLNQSKSQTMDSSYFVFCNQNKDSSSSFQIVLKKREKIIDTIKVNNKWAKIKKQEYDSLSVIFPFMQSKFSKCNYNSDTVQVMNNYDYLLYKKYFKIFHDEKWIFKRGQLSTCDSNDLDSKIFRYRHGIKLEYTKVGGSKKMKIKTELIKLRDSLAFPYNSELDLW